MTTQNRRTFQDLAFAEARRRTHTRHHGTRTEDAEYIAAFIDGATWAIPDRDDLIDAITDAIALIDAITDAIAWTSLDSNDLAEAAAGAADAILNLFHGSKR